MTTARTAARPRKKAPARRVLEELHSTAWAITPEALETMMRIAARTNLDPEAVAAQLGRPLDNTHTVTMRDGVATVPVCGPMFRHADLFALISGATSYATIATDLETALADPSVRAILLDIDSPGGEVNGCAELAALIHAARARKPVTAYVSGQGCSAAYWLASAASEVVCASTAILGCLGVRFTYQDTSERDAARGVREIEIISSQTPRKDLDPTNDAGRAQVQEMVDSLAAVFLADVARYRAVGADVVASDFGQGGVLVGAAAVAAGLADRLGTYETVHAAMRDAALGAPSNTSRNAAPASRPSASTSPNRAMTTQKKSTAPAAAAAIVAAAFAADARVRATTAKDVLVEEGAEGTVAEVREGAFYSVQYEDGTFAWHAEDELEAAGADEGETGENADETTAAEGEETDEEEKPAARALTRTAVIAAAQLAGGAAERTRILGIQALARPGREAVVAACVNDPACTVDAAARRILEAEKSGQTSRIAALKRDEQTIEKPAPGASNAVEPSADDAGTQRILANAKSAGVLKTPTKSATK